MALKWLDNFKNAEGQLARWIESLAEFDCEIQHRPGKKHSNADGMSRRPCRQCCRPECYEPNPGVGRKWLKEESDLECRLLSIGAVWTHEKIIQEQSDDPDTKPIFQAKMTSEIRPEWSDISC